VSGKSAVEAVEINRAAEKVSTKISTEPVVDRQNINSI
jgi:hypothetical protein